ncbi:hypothetical protein [Ciceribacter sp. RN22]|uniref:hypothetical protein n=1 Tax=Ciceribacter sp. RN22 TaxID=2954932 RepID=UPI0020936881|nr:hypothetical protein [Ciceribacter sp. RN22]MCO6180866.1 hypothetical protein [Ciceribacter sp. RN22]
MNYDQERLPHAIAMINLAKFSGKKAMPRNALLAFFNHGMMRIIHHIPFARNFFEELGIKPRSRFRAGLFRKAKSACGLLPGALLPQGWVRAQDGRLLLSDDALGEGFALVDFGCDPCRQLDGDVARRFAGVKGKSIQISFRGQRLGLAADEVYEDLEGAFLPRVAKAGRVAVIRPDRTVMHTGPADDVTRVVGECLDLLQAP